MREQRLDPFEPEVISNCCHCDAELFDGVDAITYDALDFCDEQCLAEHLIAMGQAERVMVE